MGDESQKNIRLEDTKIKIKGRPRKRWLDDVEDDLRVLEMIPKKKKILTIIIEGI